MRALAASLGQRLGLPADWAVIRQPETFALARARLGAAAEGQVLVVPFFLSEGYFVRVRLPRLLADHGFAESERLALFGALPGLIDLISARIGELAGDTAMPKVLVVAHGSASGEIAPRQVAERMAEALARRGAGDVHLAFIEEPPSVATQIAAVRPEIVVGLFASEGTHALDDVAALVATAPSVTGHIAAIGADPSIPAIVAAAVRVHIGEPNAAG
ncbi:MAG: CbiX/SirB N-terminal domain-containing protein [Ancalomicrobiaceae bacterium]|nr:CbiX/SirB N-terminal domain-containing protein [Ancalomicrobiaceae bacterium]